MGPCERATSVLVLRQLRFLLILVASTAPISSASRPWLHVNQGTVPPQPGSSQVSQNQGTGSHVISSCAGLGGHSWQPSEPPHAPMIGSSEPPRAEHRALRVNAQQQLSMAAHAWQPVAQPGRQLLQGGAPPPAQPPASPGTGPPQVQDGTCLVSVTFGVTDGRGVDSSATNSTPSPSLLGQMAIEPAAQPVQVRL
jgi:hypothetical protein